MEQRVYHGPLAPTDVAQALIGEFDHGNLHARGIGEGEEVVVQIASLRAPASGGRTAIAVHIASVEDGVLVRIGQQQWFGVAASLGVTALAALRNPMTLLGRLDDVAQDLASLQLTARIWATVERVAAEHGARFELSERLRRLMCDYCGTANPVGEPSCVACGAPLGEAQPVACPVCGFVSAPGARFCSSCGSALA